MPLGAFAYSAVVAPDKDKQPKTPKQVKQPKKAKEPGDSTEKSISRHFPQLFSSKSRSSTNSGKGENNCDSPTKNSSSAAQVSSPLGRQESVLKSQRPKHIPITIPDFNVDSPSHGEAYSPNTTPQNPVYTPELATEEESSPGSTPRASSPRLDIPRFPLPAVPFPTIPLPAIPVRAKGPPRTPQAKIQPRHVEIVVPYPPHSLLSEPSSLNQQIGARCLSKSESDPFITNPMEMSRSAASSRTNTFDSETSVPSPHQLYSRKGSSAQISINSSQSSLGGRDEYASEHESMHNGHNSFHQGRSNGASPANPNTPGQSQNQNLSGLVCNVHRTTGKEPPPLVGATTTVLGDKLYVFGGRRISRSRPHLTSDIYELDLLLRHWIKLDTKGDIPAPRYFHSVCALGDNKLVCYGGMSPEPTNGQAGLLQGDPQEPQVTVMSDVHIYDTPTRTWTRVASTDAPQGRYAHCAAILPSSAVFASAQAPVSALHHNPSGANPNVGTLGTQIDGAGGAEMIVVGGQDSENHYIEQISVFNLRSLTWTSTSPMSGRSCGAYRSVVTPLTTMNASRIGAGPGRPDEDEDDDDDSDDTETLVSGSPMLIYTNYNFLDVKLELQVRLPDGSLVDKPMQGSVTPPGLRFPSGGIIDNHFVVSGTFLTSSKQEFSLWALDLRTLTWSRIDTGSNIFSQGSWNRGVLWTRRNAFVILGNRKRNLVDDYNNRRLNFSNMCVIQLEAFGLYDNPRKTAPNSDYISGSAPVFSQTSHAESLMGGRQMSAAAELLGELALNARELCDMDVLAIDGTRLSVNSRLIARRWGPYFNTILREGAASFEGASAETATLRPAAASILSRNSSITITPSLSSGATTLTANTTSTTSNDPADVRALPPNSRPRTLYLPHMPSTLQALVHYLYTSSMPPLTSPLSNPQILSSLLQLARPYKIDGLLECVLQRLHSSMDGRNAAAVFNAAAMAAGGGQGVAFATGSFSNGAGIHPPRTVSLAGIEALNIGHGGSISNGAGARGLRIDTDVANGNAGGDGRSTRNTLRGDTTDDEDDVPDSASTTNSLGSQVSMASTAYGGVRREDREVWAGEWSAVIGLQKRGLRGLMEGRRAREKGRNDSAPPSEQRIGLGIA